MKPKPISHRTSNTFRFQGFQQKIRGIKVSSRAFVLKKDTSDDESVTLFWQCILKWRELNLTSGFKEFQKEIGSDCQTVAQIILNEERIARTIIDYLTKADVLVQPPLLHSLVAFARDIPSIFYEKYFYLVITNLVSLLETKCHETIENLFVCFVSLFTSLQKYLKIQLQKLFIEKEFSVLFSKKYPWYINELAAQSLSSLIRRIPNKEEFFVASFRLLNKSEYDPVGIGRLLFHSLKSDVARRLHSSAANTFEILLNILNEKDIPLVNSCSSISCCLKSLAFYVTANNANISGTWQETWKQDSGHIWPIILTKLSCYFESENLISNDRHILVLKSYLQLIVPLVQFKQGSLIINESEILKNVFQATIQLEDHDVGEVVSEITSLILSSPHTDKSSTFLKFVLDYFLESKFSYNIIFNFVSQTLNTCNFDSDILPFTLKYILKLSSSIDDESQSAILNCLGTIIVSKHNIIKTGDDLKELKIYPLDFNRYLLKKKSCQKAYSNIIGIFDSIIGKSLDLSLNSLNDLEPLILSCICLPHVYPLKPQDSVPNLILILEKIFDLLNETPENLVIDYSTEVSHKKKKKLKIDNPSRCPNIDFNVKQDFSDLSNKLLFLVNIIIETLFRLLSSSEFVSAVKNTRLFTFILEKLQYRDNVDLLRSLDIFLTAAANEDDPLICEDNLVKIYISLAPCLTSYQHTVRLLVTHIFNIFPVDLPADNLTTFDCNNMFYIMFEVERASVSPHNYKDRLRILSQLDNEHIHSCKPTSGVYEQAPLLFLIGQLYINFKELWQPTISSIKGYAHTLPEVEFWPIWLSKLKAASFMTLKVLCNMNDSEENIINFENHILQDMRSSYLVHPGFSHLSTRVDHLNFRDLLWQCMQQFPGICERKNHDVVTLFFDFLHKELFPADFNVAPTQDVSLHVNTEMLEAEVDDLETLINVDTCVTTIMDATVRKRKVPTNSLCEIMAVFAKFKNPKGIHKAKDLENVYLEFLSHPYLRAQRLALDAIMAYNYKFLNPYSESLYKILDDKTFKDEITLFSIDGDGVDESKSLKEEHRNQFMPILMRILYGKMQYKTGGHTSGKSKTGVRKAIVLRFLAGANENELDTFLNLSFDVLMHHIEGSPLDIIERVDLNFNPQKVVPLKRLLGALGTLETVFEKIGGLLDTKKPFMLKVVLFILYTSVSLLERKEEVCSHFYPLLKSIRQLALKKIVTFFTNYEHYEWNSDEIEAVLRAAVWPSLERLPFEGIYSPTPLHRLFSCWADNQRYHSLLASHHPEKIELTPMRFIVNLINHPKCSNSVVDITYNMIEKLLKNPSTDADSGMDEDIDTIVVKNILPITEEADGLGLSHLSFGEMIVLSNRDDLLKNLKHKLLALSKGQMVNNRDLTILIRMSEWIKNEEVGQDLLDFIVPLLKKNCIKQNEKVAYLLDTSSRLIKIVENPEQFLIDFLFMFSTLNGRLARSSLCQTIDAISKREPKYEVLSTWCMNLNAWNLKMVDEIDYEIRIKSYREIGQHLSSSTCLDEHTGLFLIYHNIWVLQEIEDQGLKNLSNLCLNNLIDLFVRVNESQLELTKSLIEQQLLPLIKMGLRNKEENVRNSFINILCVSVHKCHAFIPRLKDLLSISNLNDPDVDFLTNMAHIQRSRRTRAMTRLSDQLNEIIVDDCISSKALKFQTDTITEFLLPIVSAFIFKEEYSTDDNLLNSSVQCIKALAKKLPWYPYHNLLKYYLKIFSRELKNLKLGVKLLEAIIDAFHEEVCDPNEFIGVHEASITNEENELETSSLAPNKAKAKRVFVALTREIIPQIRKTLSQRSVRDTEHKVNKKKYPEDEDIKRIPLALALIKLLKKLPKRILNNNVNNVLSKLITFLQSKSIFIRREARLMLVKVLQELGGEYLSCLIKDLNSILARGYQSHVMVFTIHAVLTDLQDALTPAHIDPCVSEIMEICIEDLFGEKAAEKEVSKITNKVNEARAEKGYSIMGIATQTVSVNNLASIMVPLKELLNTHNKKIVNKVCSCLQKIANGLDRNKNISIEHKSIFTYGIINEKIKELSKSKSNKQNKSKISKMDKSYPIDSFLLAPEPKKVDMVPKISHKATSHALIEFALNLLHVLLKHGHFISSNIDHCGLLDTYVSIMSDCLLSDFPQVSIYALNVLSCLIKFPLPSLKQNLSKICGQIFIILNKFSSSGLTKGKLFELVQLCFKTIASIIKDVNFYELEPEHLSVLLHYARINLDDHNQHHSTFTILEAIISRKIQALELHDLMSVIRELSIISSNLNMLDQARCTYFKYMMNYPKNQKQHIKSLDFFLNNISFDVPAGKMSASLMINELISKYPRSLFDKHLEVRIWFKLTDQLLKEESKDHRILLQKSLKELYRKSERKRLHITNCLNLMEDNPSKSKAENALIVHLSAQSLLAFLENPAAEQPEIMFSKVIPKIVALLHPGRYQLDISGNDELNESDLDSLDITLESLLIVITKLMDIYMTKGNLLKWEKAVGRDLWKYIQEHLLYPNLKVRLRSAALFGKLFGLYPLEEGDLPMVAANSNKVKSLIIDFCEQLNTESPIETPMLSQLGMAVARNLIYLIRLGKKIPIELPGSKKTILDNEDVKDDNGIKTDSFVKGTYDVLHRVGVMAYDELRTKGKKSILRREALLNLIAGVVQILDAEFKMCSSIVSFVMKHLIREMSDEHLPEILSTRTKEVNSFVRDKLGAEIYNEEMLRVQLALERKRNKRKATEKELVVSNPEVAMRKKAKKQIAKKQSKKRKFAELKLKPNKKRRLRDLAMVSS